MNRTLMGIRIRQEASKGEKFCLPFMSTKSREWRAIVLDGKRSVDAEVKNFPKKIFAGNDFVPLGSFSSRKLRELFLMNVGMFDSQCHFQPPPHQKKS